MILKGNYAREGLLMGIREVKRAAMTSLGPNGRNTIIESETNSIPRITKDGATIVKSIQYHDRMKEIGASLLRQSADQTNKFAGDGTTTSTLIAASIFEIGQRFVRDGHDNIKVAQEIKQAKNRVQEFLKEIRTIDESLLYQVALLSSNYDEQIAKCVYEGIKAGNVTVEPGGVKTTIKIQQATQITRGLLHQLFADKGKSNQTLNHPLVYTSLKPLEEISEIVPILNTAKEANSSILIIAKDISQDVLSNLIFNHTKDIIQIGALTIPGFGTFSDDLIGDIAALCGSENGLGQIVKAEINQFETFLHGTNGDCEHRLQQIQGDSKVAQERRKRFDSKSAIIYVGGSSEAELHENRDKIIDALNATRSTLKNGVLPGGGSAYFHASKLLEGFEDNGSKILKAVLRQPLKYLCQNSHINYGQIAEYLTNENDFNIGFDQRKQCFANMIDQGVIDSFQVVSQALEDGVSLGSMLLTTDVAIFQDSYTPTPLKYYRKEFF
ncbi:hypothetical protein pb186bvf_007396 [Paramecium bursaria]